MPNQINNVGGGQEACLVDGHLRGNGRDGGQVLPYVLGCAKLLDAVGHQKHGR